MDENKNSTPESTPEENNINPAQPEANTAGPGEGKNKRSLRNTILTCISIALVLFAAIIVLRQYVYLPGQYEAEDGSTVYTMGTVDSEKVAAWLDASASPGEYGNAIFNGHVSWKKVAGVFSVLPKMEEGEEIIVEYDDGSTMTFTVTNVDIYGIDDVPETVMAYDTGDSRMTLITCYGESWNSGLGTRNQRCVVVAKPVDSSKIITPPAVTPNPDEDCDT